MALIVVLTNTSQLAPISNYNYEVLVGDGSLARSKSLAKGVVDQHRRDDGWEALVQRVLDQERVAA